MAEQSLTPPPAPPPPPLPPRLLDPVPVIVAGTGLWFLAFLGVLLFARDNTTLLWTCLCGGLLGLIGYGVFSWQRAASRRGSRTAQRGLDRS
ncbi:DUF2530 domain-containing protein [Saccharothrix coeruleofusca]|uniref:DUF2530 domain-containing protein n=1 Tax=Saccharothrix coeruleofusca TaxID=33919 RepID=A0A918EAK1_9PSEU|nr:DUF2530 domain-containing protein [Saccharothrix coeruleofusca]MBP2340533.1 arginine exporter protein ArgO [Saccharothrix coeruleofusca]GGP34795.1 hypothetical protein GCM10010185_01870 [Saccharothrix coeruleofusca]